ncbi:MAG: DUF177 domain-containing protein [Rubricoccaceae bacterium]|nr:DUF177 domain-containing protein [Rubricoccaceae bacterium]
MLKIDIAALADGLHDQTLRVPPDALDLDPAVFSEAVLELRLDVADHRILAAFDVASVATLTCDRTLVDYEQPVRGRHTVLFVSPDRLPPEGDDEDVRPLPDDATALDLTEPVRDTLLLALPLRRVAPEAEDAEIPSSFGAPTDGDGHPIDDRWEALRRLRDDS